MGCLKLSYQTNETALKVVYGGKFFEQKNVQRFLSVDPLSSQFPFYSPYQYAGNKPIWATDLDGAEELILPRIGIPDPVLTLPKIPIPAQPLPPIPPAIPQGLSMPQNPTLPPSPYMPLPPPSPSIVRNSTVDESSIDPNDASTYPTPPSNLEGEWKVTPVKSGTRGYNKLKEKGATRLENERGDILRWHKTDDWHPKGHWDLKRGGNVNNEWENFTPDGVQIPKGKIYGKDFNPAVLISTDIFTYPSTQYPTYLEKQYQQSKQKMLEYYKKKDEYNKQMREYEKKMKEYEKKKQEYDKKMEQYRKDHPHLQS